MVFLLLFIAVIIAPWWVVPVILFCATLYYRWYLEGIGIGYIFDVWYAPEGVWWAVVYAIILVLCGEVLARVLGVRRN